MEVTPFIQVFLVGLFCGLLIEFVIHAWIDRRRRRRLQGDPARKLSDFSPHRADLE